MNLRQMPGSDADAFHNILCKLPPKKGKKRSGEAHTGKGLMGRQLILWFVIIVMVVLGSVGIAVAALIGLLCLVGSCVARLRSERMC